MTRRQITLIFAPLLALALIIPTAWLWLGPGSSQAGPHEVLDGVEADTMVVFMSPTCGCCGDWVTHLEEHGFSVETRETDQVNLIKQQAGLPRDLVSCHTGFINGYLIEGHVPAEDIQRLLAEKPRASGLSVPRMPMGSPGMEMEGYGRDAFDVVLFHADGGREVYNTYPAISAL
ncbi:MAG: DUF411 domain-containing protein [Halomonadaceae bacterium]|nr:MAG: DUF411 domain-containing protein [Halomonadaceae bacterium]